MGYNGLMQYASYLIMLSICIDQGDGRWKERDKVKLRHDIMVYRKMAEKLEHEIDKFYDEYPDEWLDENVDRINQKYLSNLFNVNIEVSKTDKEKNINNNQKYFSTTIRVIDTPVTHTDNVYPLKEINNKNVVKQISKYNNKSDYQSGWPKFEDVLMSIGRKYDWKNDRWIKVKEKLEENHGENNIAEAKRVKDFHEKHKFSYRVVKLNRSKSRRNIVVAVSAVR